MPKDVSLRLQRYNRAVQNVLKIDSKDAAKAFRVSGKRRPAATGGRGRGDERMAEGDNGKGETEKREGERREREREGTAARWAVL